MPKGLLKLTVHGATLLKDIESFSKQDPFCKVTLGSNAVQTKVHDNAGKVPVWNESFDLKVDGEPELVFEVWDKESLKKDRIIANGDSVPWSKIFGSQKKATNFPCKDAKGNDMGTVSMTFEFIEDKPLSPKKPAADAIPAKVGDSAKPAPAAEKPAVVAGTINGTLKITVHQAKELKDMETFGKQDPYCKITIGEQKQQTKVHTDGGKSASWEQDFTFDLEKGMDTVRFECYDKEMVTKDDFIGGVTLSIAAMLAKAKTPQWYTIEGDKKNAGKKHGEIMISAQLLPPSADKGGELSEEMKKSIIPYSGKQAGIVKLTVHKGRELKNTEMMGKQDPYAKVAIGGEKFKTKTHTDGGKAPVWEQTFTFNIDEAADKLQLEVWDTELTSDDFIGMQVIPLTGLLAKQLVPVWHEIRGRGKEKDVICGDILLTAQFMKAAAAPEAANADAPLFVSQNGILKITMHKGKDLYNTSLMGKQDPYVKMLCGTAAAKTKVHSKGGKMPSWEQDFTLNILQGDTHIHLECWDAETVSDDFIGEVDLPLTKVLRNPNTPVWYDIFGRKDKAQQKRGELMMTAEFFPSGDGPTAEAEVWDPKELADPKVYNSSMSGTLELILHKGQNLFDTNLMGKQDPFCKLKIGREAVKSKTHGRGGKFPSWEQTFAFTVEEGDDMLFLECWDEETVSNDFIGERKLPIAKLLNLPDRPCWYELRGKGDKAQSARGEIMITAKWTADVDAPSVPLPDKLNGMLKLTVFKGRDLYNTSMLGKQDPFCEVVIGTEKYKTKTHTKGGQFPIWGEDFTFNVTPEMKTFELTAWDWETVSNDFIGTTKLLLRDVLEKQKKPRWYKIHGKGDKAAEARGEIMIAAEFYGAGDSVGGKGDKFTQGDKGSLQITAHKAQNLFNTEMFGKQDPYCKFIMGDVKFNSKTHTDGGLNPRWEEKFTFNVEAVDEMVKCEVWDKELTSDDFIGFVDIPLTKLLGTQGPPEWYTLHDKKEKEAGKILLSARFFSPKGDVAAIKKKAEVAESRKEDDEAKKKLEAEKKKKAEEDAAAKAKAEADKKKGGGEEASKTKREDEEAAAAKAKRDAEDKAKRDAEDKAKKAAQDKKRKEAEEQENASNAEKDRLALLEAERLRESARKRKSDVAKKAREEREARAKEEADKQAAAEDKLKLAAEVEKKKADQLRKAKADRLKREAEEAEEKKKEEERKKAEAELAKKSNAERRRQDKLKAKKQAEADRKKAEGAEEERRKQQELTLLSLTVRFSDLDMQRWEKDKSEYDKEFVAAIAKTTGLPEKEFDDVSLKAGSTIAKTSFTVEFSLIEPIRKTLEDLDFTGKLLGIEPFDDPILTNEGPAPKKKPKKDKKDKPKKEKKSSKMLLKVTVHRCKNLKDMAGDNGGRQDPHVQVKLDKQKFVTPSHKGGGAFPVFDKTYLFSVDDDDKKNKLKLEVWDNMRQGNMFLGECSISLKKLAKAASPSWWPLEGKDDDKHEDKHGWMSNGQILLGAEFIEAATLNKHIEGSEPATARTMPGYRQALKYLSKAGLSHHLEVPRIVALGLRGSGKTSVLSAISGISIPSSNAGPTRCPMEIYMQCSKDHTNGEGIHDKTDYYPPTEPSQAPSMNDFGYHDIQSWLDSNDGWRGCLTIRAGDASHSRYEPQLEDRALLPYVHKLSSPTELYQAIATAQQFVVRNDGYYSTSAIQVHIRGPTVPDLCLVDIPGIANDPITQEIASEYLQEKDSLVLTVLSCDEGSIDRQDNLLRFIRKQVGSENVERRLIGVLTKPDHIEGSYHYWQDLVEGRTNPRGMGTASIPWFVVKTGMPHSYSDLLQSPVAILENEIRFFSNHEAWDSVGPYRKQVGTRNLKSVISDILDRRLMHALPSLQKAISHRETIIEDELNHVTQEVGKGAVISKALYTMVAAFDQKLKREVYATRDSYANYSDVLWTGSTIGEQNVHPVVFAATAAAAASLGELGQKANENRYMYTHVRDLFQKFKDQIFASKPNFDEEPEPLQDKPLAMMGRSQSTSRISPRPSKTNGAQTSRGLSRSRNFDGSRSQRDLRDHRDNGDHDFDGHRSSSSRRGDRGDRRDSRERGDNFDDGDQYRSRNYDGREDQDRDRDDRHAYGGRSSRTPRGRYDDRERERDLSSQVKPSHARSYFDKVKESILHHRNNGIAGSISNSVVHHLIQEFVTQWRPAAFQCLSDVRDLMQSKLFILVREVFGSYHKLESVIAGKCRELLDREYKVLSELRRLGFNEGDYPNVADIAEAHPGLVPIITQKICGTTAMRKTRSANDATTPQIEHEVYEVISSVKAYYSIASRRFADYIPMSVDLSLLVKYLKKLESELIPEICDVGSSAKDSMGDLMQEDKSKVGKRKQLEEDLENIRKARKALSLG